MKENRRRSKGTFDQKPRDGLSQRMPCLSKGFFPLHLLAQTGRIVNPEFREQRDLDEM